VVKKPEGIRVLLENSLVEAAGRYLPFAGELDILLLWGRRLPNPASRIYLVW
jgi:hypothetical protein